MNDEDIAYARNAIRQLIWSGFYTPERVLEIVTEEIREPGEIDPESARAWIEEEAGRKAEAELGWPEVTDCDRLTAAFAELEAGGIIALENAGNTQSEGVQEAMEIYMDLGDEKSGVAGYCFYHWQDLESVVDGGGLWLAFGDIEGDDTRGVAIGERVVSTLARHGLAAVWPGTITQRIEIPKIVWQRRWTADTDGE